MERTDLASMQSGLYPFFERRTSADTIKISTWRQNKEQKTIKFNNLEEGRKKCKLALGAGGRDGEDTEVFCCVS